jgi:hypothetical protein
MWGGQRGFRRAILLDGKGARGLQQYLEFISGKLILSLEKRTV